MPTSPAHHRMLDQQAKNVAILLPSIAPMYIYIYAIAMRRGLLPYMSIRGLIGIIRIWHWCGAERFQNPIRHDDPWDIGRPTPSRNTYASYIFVCQSQSPSLPPSDLPHIIGKFNVPRVNDFQVFAYYQMAGEGRKDESKLMWGICRLALPESSGVVWMDD